MDCCHKFLSGKDTNISSIENIYVVMFHKSFGEENRTDCYLFFLRTITMSCQVSVSESMLHMYLHRGGYLYFKTIKD